MRDGRIAAPVWLLFALLIVLFSLACDDESKPAAQGTPGTPGPAWFEDVAAERGMSFVAHSGHRDIHLFPESVYGGGALFDMDGDGDLDAYILQAGSLYTDETQPVGNQLFENLGDGRFKDVSEGSGSGDPGYGMGVACGDYDNDGDVDLYLTNYGPNVLLRNDGEGTFTDITTAAGVGHDGFGSSTGFLDYDLDGDLDLFVVNYVNWHASAEVQCSNVMGGQDYCAPGSYDSPAMDVLYRNNGDGTFENVTEPAGLPARFGNGLGFIFGDFNSDGWPDIFVANDLQADQLWFNDAGKRFDDRALLVGCGVDLEGGVPKAGMGVAAGDLDDDGDLDLMVCNIFNESDSVYRNEGDYFVDITSVSGLGYTSRPLTRFGVGWVDFNNDGYFDLYQANGRIQRTAPAYSENLFDEPNLLFRGTAEGRFVEVKPRGGTTDLLAATSRAAAFGDIDDDGGMDVLVVNRDAPVHLLRNVVPDRGHWISFRVVEEHGRDALGSVVSLSNDGRRLTRSVRSGYSYLACNDSRVHFGLAEQEHVEQVLVRWLDGGEERFGPYEANRVVTLTRGEGQRR
jgi:hypothetical protein